jgi:hypothetical protein
VSERDARRARGQRRLRPFSPAGFLFVALVLAAAYLLCHAIGMREYVSSLPMVGVGRSARAGPVVLGLLYVVVYLAFVVGAPILVIASGIFAAVGRLFQRRLPGRRSDRV